LKLTWDVLKGSLNNDNQCFLQQNKAFYKMLQDMMKDIKELKTMVHIQQELDSAHLSPKVMDVMYYI